VSIGLSPPEGGGDPGTPVEVYRSADGAACRDRALVLTAVGIDHRTLASGGAHRLLVAGRDAVAAAEQLRRFELENAAEAPDDRLRVRAGFRVGALLWCLALAACFLCERRGAFGLPWLEAGRADAARIRAGQAWRAVTALCLHADAAHLLGNLVFGALFVGAACQVAGLGAGLLLTLASGAAGNLLAAALRPGAGASIGASTAVFGALGVLAALQWRRRRRRRTRPVRRWAPVIAALLLLAYLGTAGERVDLLAHLTGMACGLVLGALWEPGLEGRLAAPVAQAMQGVLAAATLAAAWLWAFAGA
jgi:membrane associated rhomboid family serine protease